VERNRKLQDFKKLLIWQKSHLLALSIYKATETFPDSERYGLISQIRRCCVSIPSNIAEECGRDGNSEFNRFLHISLGSTAELEYQLLLASDLKMLNEDEYKQLENQVHEVRKMLVSFIRKLNEEN